MSRRRMRPEARVSAVVNDPEILRLDMLSVKMDVVSKSMKSLCLGCYARAVYQPDRYVKDIGSTEVV